jgi:DNA-binding transcriptional MerR regulator
MQQELTIEDLAEESGLSLRTIRYYMQEGLLPGPDTAGKYASYSQTHLDHLAMIQRLKALHLPLKEIRHLIENMTEVDMHRILEYQDAFQLDLGKHRSRTEESRSPGSKSSALDYIRELEERQVRYRSLADSPAPKQSINLERRGLMQTNQPNNAGSLPEVEKESWTKIILQDDVELSIREKPGEKYQREIGELIRFAENLFKSRSKGGPNK